jgi:hypothetical protein
LFFNLGLFLVTNNAYAQFSQSGFAAQGNADPVVQFFDTGHSNAFTEADSIMDQLFRGENEADIIADYLQSSTFNQGNQDQQLNKEPFRFHDPSLYFASASGNGAMLQNQFPYSGSFRLRNEGESIWKKMGRAEFFIGGTEVLCMGILMAMPKEVTKWEPGFLQSAKKNLKRAFTTMPENDEDAWGFNYIGHPIAGSLYYNAIRSQDATIFQSFLFSFAQSAIWEYVIEGMAEQPSLQDLIITPIFGTLLGEASHMATIKMRRNGFNWLEKITVIVINPFYAVNNGFGSTNKKVITR